MERRLAAVMIADVAGYGRLSQADEEGTRARSVKNRQGRLATRMGWSFLIEILMLAVIIVVPTAVHWLWTGRKAPLVRSYYRVLLYYFMWFGVLLAIFAAIIFACILADWLGHAGWGYPLWSAPFAVIFIGLGVLIFRVARSFVRRGSS